MLQSLVMKQLLGGEKKRKSGSKFMGGSGSKFMGRSGGKFMGKSEEIMENTYLKRLIEYSCMLFLVYYAMNIISVFPEYRNIPWIKEILDKVPSGLLAKTNHSTFLRRFFAAHGKSMNLIPELVHRTVAMAIPDKKILGFEIQTSKIVAYTATKTLVMPLALLAMKDPRIQKQTPKWVYNSALLMAFLNIAHHNLI
jgi:hypothetical protein